FMKGKKSFYWGIAGLFLLAAFISGFSGCNSPLISSVTYDVAENLETIKVKLNFGDHVNSDLGGSFPIGEYGYLEVEPSSSTNPFNVGFRLDLSIFEDQDILNLKKVTSLPSGQPIPGVVNRALVEIQS